MRFLADLVVALLFAAWLVAIATVSVQNYELVALQFLNFSSIPFPFGVILAFSAGIGAISSTIALRLVLWRS